MISRSILCLLLVLSLGAPAKAREVITFGIQPQWTRAQMERMFQPLMEYLTEKTGYEFRLRVTEDYGSLLDEMKSGIIDVGKFNPYGYVLARKSQGVKIFVTELTYGRPYYHGYIITRKDKGINTIEELRGRSFGYTSPHSTSGFIYPRAMLVEKGEDPSKYFKKSSFSGSHDVCIRGVYAGDVDAGATWDVAYDDETDSALLGVKGEEMKIIYKTEPIPNDAYAARADLDEEIVKAIQDAFLDLSKDEKRLAEAIDWRTRIDGFVVGDDAAYNVVREKVAMKDLKQRLAILPFDKKGKGFRTDRPGEIATELLSTSLFDSQRFIMIERAKLDKALAEQRLELQDLVDESTAVQVGNVLGANVLLMGSVMILDGVIHVTSRLIETESGKILSAQHAKGNGLDKVITEIAANIVADYDVKGFVLKSKGTVNVTVDLGTLQGIRAGDMLRVYRLGETLQHPVTGKVLGTEELLLGEIVVVRTTPEISFGKVVASEELIIQGFRVRTLTKDEISPTIKDPTGVISSYLDDERAKYEPWLNKYAWRIAAFGTLPFAWSLFEGNNDEKLIYGCLAGALWAITGISFIYYSATKDSRRVPSYLKSSTTHMFGIRGSF